MYMVQCVCVMAYPYMAQLLEFERRTSGRCVPDWLKRVAPTTSDPGITQRASWQTIQTKYPGTIYILRGIVKASPGIGHLKVGVLTVSWILATLWTLRILYRLTLLDFMLGEIEQKHGFPLLQIQLLLGLDIEPSVNTFCYLITILGCIRTWRKTFNYYFFAIVHNHHHYFMLYVCGCKARNK